MKTKGFTVIEVLIVLAIAGLILIIVFLAIPSLQRNSRNKVYKTDAANLLAAATEFMSNNNSAIPNSSHVTEIQELTNTRSITDLQIVNGNTTAIMPDFDMATLDTGVQCPASISGNSVTPVPSSGSALALIYAVEGADGSVVAQCTEA